MSLPYHSKHETEEMYIFIKLSIYMLSIYDYMSIAYRFYHGRQGRRDFLFLEETAWEAFSSIFLMETHQYLCCARDTQSMIR